MGESASNKDLKGLCKRTSLTVSKKAPIVSKKVSPVLWGVWADRGAPGLLLATWLRVPAKCSEAHFWGNQSQLARSVLGALFAGVLRGNTIRGNTTRNSERKMAL